MSDAAPDLPEWILPRRPDILAFLRGASLVLLPIACMAFGPTVFIPAMIIAVGVGVGTALAWTVLAGRRWWSSAALSTILVIGVHAATAVNLWLVPRFDVLFRAHAIAETATAWVQAGAVGDPPTYDTGQGRGRWNRAPDGIVSSDPLLRWTPFGWRPSCLLHVGTDGTAKILPIRDE
jgi:hypothetical protein